MSSHAEIAAAVTSIYEFLVKIGYIDHDEVNWAPHTNKPLLEDKCREVGLTDNAIELLRLLPWLDVERDILFIDETYFVDFSNEECVQSCRNIQHYMPHDQKIKMLQNNQFFLTAGHDEWSLFLIVNADTGKIRRWYEPNCGVDTASIEGNGAAVLGEVLRELTSLSQIPIRGERFYSRGEDEEHDYLKEMLIEYGWPDQFRRDEFIGKSAGAARQWQADQEKLRSEHPELVTQSSVEKYREEEEFRFLWQDMFPEEREQTLKNLDNEPPARREMMKMVISEPKLPSPYDRPERT